MLILKKAVRAMLAGLEIEGVRVGVKVRV